jgi:hypothetical protein
MLQIESRPAAADVALEHAAEFAGAPPLPTGEVTETKGYAISQRKPQGTAFGTWLDEVLGKQQGVLAALPRSAWPVDTSAADSTVGRIVALDRTRNVGKAAWWLHSLRTATYAYDTAFRSGPAAATYSTDGLDDNDWFPTHPEYDGGIDEDQFDKLTLAGFSVTVRSFAAEASGLGALPALQQRLLLELEAGAMHTGPAVLATKMVHGQEDKAAVCVSVTQAYSFRLRDMLTGLNQVLGDPILRPQLAEATSGIYEATAAIARKLRTLAGARILKLNVTPNTVVFCPALQENADSGTLEATGYGYVGLKGAKGVPFVVDFDPATTKRVSSQAAEYDADCAYVAMALVLISSTRAQHGELAARTMLYKLTGKRADGRALPVDELPEGFEQGISLVHAAERARDNVVAFGSVLRSVLPTFEKQHALVLTAAYDDAAHDLTIAVQPGALESGASEMSVFHKLACFLLDSRKADTAVFAALVSDADLALEREVAQRVEQRVSAVR